MFIECFTNQLCAAVSNVRRSVNNRSSIAALEGILFKACDGVVTLNGYNIGFGIKTFFNTKIIEEGEVVLNGRIFYDIVRNLPGEKVEIKVDDKNVVNIKSENSEFNIAGIKSDEFPSLPRINEDFYIKMPSNLLKDMIKQTIFSVASELVSIVHNGILFEIEKDKIRLVAVDGFRMALREEFIINENIEEKQTVIIPERTLNEILNLLPESDEEVKIYVSKTHILLVAENYELFSVIINDKFLEYKNIIPQNIKTSFCSKTNELLKTVERVSLIVEEKLKKPVVFNIKDEEINFSCNSSIGKATDKLELFINGENMDIAFNNKYVLDALKHVNEEEIKIEFESPEKPMKITPSKGGNFMFLVLPVRI